MMASDLDSYPEFQSSIRPPTSILYHDWATRFPPLHPQGSSGTALRLLNVSPYSLCCVITVTDSADGGRWSSHAASHRLFWHYSPYHGPRGMQGMRITTHSVISDTNRSYSQSRARHRIHFGLWPVSDRRQGTVSDIPRQQLFTSPRKQSDGFFASLRYQTSTRRRRVSIRTILSTDDIRLLPSGFIHGVMTKRLSSLLSCNFLHDYAIPKRGSESSQ